MEHVRTASVAGTPPPARSCIAADFETQSALLLGCNELQAVFPKLLVEIVAALIGIVPLIGIVDTEEQRRHTIAQLCDWGLPAHRMHFLH